MPSGNWLEISGRNRTKKIKQPISEISKEITLALMKNGTALVYSCGNSTGIFCISLIMNKNGSPPKRILLAEDDEDDFILFREALDKNKEPVRLQWVKDGEELMDTLKMNITELPDIIFLDINMPRKNGFECLTEIRLHEQLKMIPVIIFSTSNDPALVSWMYNAGTNFYLNKPTDFNGLKEKIQKAIGTNWDTHRPFSPVKEFVL
jgi:CheY-like chemotaxis protein